VRVFLFRGKLGSSRYCSENEQITPSPLVGEGGGEGEHDMATPASILPHQGGG
jgi:hypothetical protein